MKYRLWWLLSAIAALLLTAIAPRLSARSAVPPSLAAFLASSDTCELVSRIEGDRVLDVEFPPPCLDEKLRLDRAIDLARQQVNDNELLPLTAESIRYRLIDEGIRVFADLAIDYPVIGLVDFELSQEVFVTLTDGDLDLRSGDTELNIDLPAEVPFLDPDDLDDLLRQVVETQLTLFDNKSLHDFLNDTRLDRRIADQSGLSVEAVNFIARAVEDDISARITEDAVILSVRFPPDDA